MTTNTAAPTWTTTEIVQKHTLVEGVDMWLTETPSTDFASLVIRSNEEITTRTGGIDEMRELSETAIAKAHDPIALALI